MKEPISSGDVAYLNPKDNGGKSAWILNFAPNEERTVKIGFMIDEEFSGKKMLLSVAYTDETQYLAFGE